ncbi:MAG: ABC transporter permease [Lachnospiraceae bacterium]|nr:ABC transporter permease [Lachnospiraceae bacterium]
MKQERQNRLRHGGIWFGGQILRAAALIVLVSVLAFFLVSVSPIDPLQTNVGQAALGAMSREQIEKLEAYWGVDTPPTERYLSWAFDFLRGDMGVSLLYRRPVAEILAEKLGNSVWLLLSAWVCSGLFGFFLGMLAGHRRGGSADRFVTGLSLVVASTPSFWIAMVLLLTFAVQLKWFPIGLGVPIGAASEAVSLADRLYHAALPAASLSIAGISSIALHTREKMIEVMESEYILFARARGESEVCLILRHGFRNILLPAVTLQFASVSEIIGGSVLVEQVFSYPGLGQAAVTAGLGGDVPLLLGITVLTAAVVFSGNLAANLLYHVIDPRIRKGGTE